MSKIKILELIPEGLRENLINEVVELLKEREIEKQNKEGGEKPSDEELKSIIEGIM